MATFCRLPSFSFEKFVVTGFHTGPMALCSVSLHVLVIVVTAKYFLKIILLMLFVFSRQQGKPKRAQREASVLLKKLH